MSPVLKKPSLVKEAFVSASLFQYFVITCGPLTHSSPGFPTGTSSLFSSLIDISVDGKGKPIDPLKFLPTGFTATIGEVSVKP